MNNDYDLVPIFRLKKIGINPFTHIVWTNMNRPLKISEVAQTIEEERFESLGSSASYKNEVRDHVARVAYLVIHPDNKPIIMDVGMDDWEDTVTIGMVYDGWHRIAAAIYKKDSFIRASISGSIKNIEKLLEHKIKR